MSLVIQLCIDTLYIMVVHEIVQLQTVGTVSAHLVETLYGVCDLKIVVVIVTGIERLVQIVVCHGMKRISVDPAGIIAVNDLAHEPEIRFYLICHCAEHVHIVKIQYICSV